MNDVPFGMKFLPDVMPRSAFTTPADTTTAVQISNLLLCETWCTVYFLRTTGPRSIVRRRSHLFQAWASSGMRSVRSRTGLMACALPEKVREPPERAGAHSPAPRLRPIPHREVRDERRGEVDGETRVGPLLEPRRRGHKQEHYAEEFSPREFHPKICRKPEVGERRRHLRQAQF